MTSSFQKKDPNFATANARSFNFSRPVSPCPDVTRQNGLHVSALPFPLCWERMSSEWALDTQGMLRSPRDCKIAKLQKFFRHYYLEKACLATEQTKTSTQLSRHLSRTKRLRVLLKGFLSCLILSDSQELTFQLRPKRYICVADNAAKWSVLSLLESSLRWQAKLNPCCRRQSNFCRLHTENVKMSLYPLLYICFIIIIIIWKNLTNVLCSAKRYKLLNVLHEMDS